MRRNLRFWTRYTWESVSVELGLVALLAVVSVLGADRLQFQLLASVIPYYLFISAALCVVMINYGCHAIYVPLLLSMGETRRNILLGFHYYRALIIAATVALSAAIWLLVPGEISAAGLGSIPTILAALVLASAIGSLMGTVYSKWKWAGTIALVVIFGGVGGLFGFAVSGGVRLDLANTLELTGVLQRLPWWLAGAAGAAFLADICFQWLLLRRQEVKL